MSYDSTFLYHAPCPHCGSSDANSVFSDGHEYCFACQTLTPAGKREEPKTNMTLIPHSPDPLSKRKIMKKTCEFFNYGIGVYNNTPCQVEDFFWKGQRVAQHIRLPDKEFRWIGDTKKVEFWGQHLWKGNHRMVIVTEGAIDAMSIAQITDCKLPVVSIPSGADSAVSCFKRNLEWINKFSKVVLAFDNDGPGKEAIEKVVPLLPVGNAYTIDLGQFKDANEMLQAGEGARLAQLVYNPDPYRPDGVISGSDMWEDLITETAPGLSIPFPILQNKLQGLRPGLFIFTAGSGIGKTTFVRELGYHLLMHHQQPLGVIPLEESRKKVAKHWAGLHLNKPLHVSIANATKEELERAYKEVLACGRFWVYDHWGSTEIDNLLAKINYMAVSLGVKWVILDHISIVVSGLDNEIGESERKTIDILMTRMRKLIESTGIGILAIVHLKRPSQGKSYNEGREVSLTDLRGSGSLEQLSDVVISLERNQQGESKNIATIRLLKDRDLGDTGVADSVIYNPFTGRMSPYEGEIKGAFKKENINEDF